LDDIPDSINLLLALDTKRVGDRGHPLLPESLDRLGIVSEIELGADQDDGNARSVMRDLRIPL
jgi:hypothetical protein